jgi:hypothetical protein
MSRKLLSPRSAQYESTRPPSRDREPVQFTGNDAATLISEAAGCHWAGSRFGAGQPGILQVRVQACFDRRHVSPYDNFL